MRTLIHSYSGEGRAGAGGGGGQGGPGSRDGFGSARGFRVARIRWIGLLSSVESSRSRFLRFA